MQKTRVGIIGCGNISGIYFQNCHRFDIIDVVACADLDQTKAEKVTAEYPGVQIRNTRDILEAPDIDIVLNLTTPNAHAAVAQAAVENGKSVYNEKPLTISREDGQKLLAMARQNNVRVGCAPDTFLGGSHQTCRKLIDDGWIGKPVAATAFMLCHGHESWHPDPEFYYKKGGGPMFDMGPYYLTALVNLLGPVKAVTGMTKTSFDERLITSQPKYGTKITVETPTHIAGIMQFAAGAVGTIITSFDVWGADVPFIEIHGTEGSLSMPDPNGFGGVIKMKRMGQAEWQEVPTAFGHMENSRSIGLADMAVALQTGRSHRANGDLAFHVLDIMHAFHEASDEQKFMTLESTCERPALLPLGLRNYALNE